MSDILEKLVKEDNLLMAYQICFDLYESASQQFLSSVIQNLRTVGTPIPAVPGSTNTGTVPVVDKERYAIRPEGGRDERGIGASFVNPLVAECVASGTWKDARLILGNPKPVTCQWPLTISTLRQTHPALGCASLVVNLVDDIL